VKPEACSLRVSSGIRLALEHEARRRKISVSTALDLAVRAWLQKNALVNKDDDEQLRLRKAASKYLGALASGNGQRSEIVSQTVRQRLARKHGR
jgi:hypothetical protein